MLPNKHTSAPTILGKNVLHYSTGSSIFSVTTSNNCIWEMIRTVGVIQVKYC